MGGAARSRNILSVTKDSWRQNNTIRAKLPFTGTILQRANALISNNSGRMGKKCVGRRANLATIVVYCGFNDLDEARFITGRIRDWAAWRKKHARCCYFISIQCAITRAWRSFNATEYSVSRVRRFPYLIRAEIKERVGLWFALTF